MLSLRVLVSGLLGVPEDELEGSVPGLDVATAYGLDISPAPPPARSNPSLPHCAQ